MSEPGEEESGPCTATEKWGSANLEANEESNGRTHVGEFDRCQSSQEARILRDPNVAVQLRDSEFRTFRCEPARHHRSAYTERGRKEVVLLGSAIIADVNPEGLKF
jgi:hypothetical protein